VQEFDYIIVGGGASGCVMASRLSENPANKVLMIERGRRDFHPWIHIPAAFFKILRAGKLYVRGQSEDYDNWAQLGAKGWSYSDCLPVFRELENNERLENEYHGAKGDLHVSDAMHKHPLSTAAEPDSDDQRYGRKADL